MRVWKKCASLLLLICATARAAEPCSVGMQVEIGSQGETQRFQVELAATQEAREQCLSGRDRLPPDTGMWFELAQVGMPGFWMRGMRFPIDLIWVSPENRVVGALTLPVCERDPCLIYYPSRAVAHVLEIAAGRFSGRAGDRVEWMQPRDAAAGCSHGQETDGRKSL